VSKGGPVEELAKLSGVAFDNTMDQDATSAIYYYLLSLAEVMRLVFCSQFGKKKWSKQKTVWL
jgi:hypothetical protein